jgi:hypothetical protein
MPEDDIDNDDEPGEEEDTPTARLLRKKLSTANKRERELEALVEANQGAARRIAFLDAGIPDTPQATFFREHYTGDLDPEVIKTAAAEHGFIEDTPTPGVAEIEAQSEAAYGGQGNVVQGSDDEFNTEVDRAAREAPRGKTSQAIDDVFRKYNRVNRG